jgi:hypothetical protein
MSRHPNPEIPLFVAAAYDQMIQSHLEAGSRLAELFPLSDETRKRWEEQEQEENDRRLALMQDHLSCDIDTPEVGLPLGTISVARCRCGEVLYGGARQHLLHVYSIVEEDHERRTGCDER